LIMHFHERRIRIAPPADSYAGKDIEDIKFYIKRLALIEQRIHSDYMPPPAADVTVASNTNNANSVPGTLIKGSLNSMTQLGAK
jgi:hypothetical protein